MPAMRRAVRQSLTDVAVNVATVMKNTMAV
jgi:hypothetical protein